MSDIRSNIHAIVDRIRRAEARAGRKEGSVKLLAATKSVDLPIVIKAAEEGIRLIGENRVQEAERKKAVIPANVKFHMIGHLQSNKVRKAVALFDCIQSIDSLKLARCIGEESSRVGRQMPIMLEVNIGHEASKSGFLQEELCESFSDLKRVPGIIVCGLMSIPPAFDAEDARPYFARLQKLGQMLFGGEAHDLSMGMSHDFEVAIEEGSTIVRIGTAIFGGRI